jgi:hypothetical protein
MQAMGSVEVYEAGPSAAMLVEGLRDFGYTLETALADVIDNSITAGATSIDVLADFNDGDARIAVLDDGSGLTENELREAMRPGGRVLVKEREKTDLGRFGLGMKTASFSQCRRMTVVSQKEGSRSSARWDLDYVADTDQWLVQVPDSREVIPWAEDLGSSGTLVVWEKLDRLISTGGDQNHREFNRRLDSARRHLEEVFHRFLQGERGIKAIRISLNGLDLVPFDPFHTKHPATIAGAPEVIGLAGGRIVVQAFTLPHHSKVSPDEWDRYAGEEGYTRSQGFYLYRARRLIVRATWFGLARQTSLTQLARVRIDMPNDMDALWKVNVLKASAHPPTPVRDRLRTVIESLSGTSRRVYTYRGRKLVDAVKDPIWERRAAHGKVSYSVNTAHPALEAFKDQLDPDLRGSWDQLMEMVSTALPIDALFVDLGDNPEAVAVSPISDEALEQLVTTAWGGLAKSGMDAHSAEHVLRATEPYRSNWGRVSALLIQMGVETS